MKYIIFLTFSLLCLAGSKKPQKLELNPDCHNVPNNIRCAQGHLPSQDLTTCQWSCIPNSPKDMNSKIPIKCKIWHDGCNNCFRTHFKEAFKCTKKVCFRMGKSYCKARFKEFKY